MGQRIIRIVSENKEQHLNKLKSCLIKRGHPEEFLDHTMAKLFSQSFKSQTKLAGYIAFVSTCNLNNTHNKSIFNNNSTV